MIPTVADNVVEPDRILVVSLTASTAYRIGSPNTAAVTISSQIIPKLTITSDTTTVPEGGAATFTIHADQAPVKDTSVNYQVIGTAQPGQDFEPLLGTALLAAGQTTVTVTLRSIRKDVSFDPTDMIVGHWPIRIGQVFVKEGDPLPPGTPILSLTDPNFTVTLQASAVRPDQARGRAEGDGQAHRRRHGGARHHHRARPEPDLADRHRIRAGGSAPSRCTKARSAFRISARPTALR